MRRVLALILIPLVAGCATAIPSAAPPRASSGQTARPQTAVVPPTIPARPVATGFLAPQIQRGAGLESVIQQDATSLTREFGTPRLDVREGDARKLQFSGQACVLDVFLYPLRQGAEPVATYVEARRSSDGQEVDRAACVAALKR